MPRPTPDQWLERCPDLKKVGSQLQGKCPNCGGNDRFHVNLTGEPLYSCRQCEDSAAIIRAAFGESGLPGGRRREARIEAVYKTADGREATVYRLDWPEDWEGRPCTNGRSCKTTSPHKHVWRGKGQPSRNLLLKLWTPQELIDSELIVIAEGEKAARAIRDAGYVGASYCGGTKAAKYADYSPVAGRPVLVWPDADSVGRKAAGIVAERALVAGAFEVRLVPVPEEASNGADAADCTAEEVRLEIEAGVSGDPVPMPDAGQGIQGPPSKHRELIRPDVYGMKAILDYLRLEIRRNARCLRMELRRAGTQEQAQTWAKQWAGGRQPGGWVALSDTLEASLRQTSREHFVFRDDERGQKPAVWTDRDLSDALLNLCSKPDTDPFQEWLKELPKWDGTQRIDRLWIDALGMLDTELTREAGRRFLVGAVRRTFEPGCIHDWIPVLVGAQGLGKSSVLRALVPASEWFSDSTQLDGTPKERMETTGPAVISEFSEMAGLERAEAAKFKTYISKTNDQLRPAYARYAVQSDRRWVGVGTANKDPDGVLPFDPTGARRYAVIESSFEGDVNDLADHAEVGRRWVSMHREQLWAEALNTYRAALRNGGADNVNLIPGHLRQAQEDSAEGHRRGDEPLRELAGQLTPYGQAHSKQGVTIAEIMMEGGLVETEREATLDRSIQKRLGRELTATGWVRRQRRVNGRLAMRWFAPACYVCVDCGRPVDHEGGRCKTCAQLKLDDALAPVGDMAWHVGAAFPCGHECPICARLSDETWELKRRVQEPTRQYSLAWEAATLAERKAAVEQRHLLGDYVDGFLALEHQGRYEISHDPSHDRDVTSCSCLGDGALVCNVLEQREERPDLGVCTWTNHACTGRASPDALADRSPLGYADPGKVDIEDEGRAANGTR